jgi:hypothetical protein
VFADGSRNDKAERIVLAAINAAVSFDKARFKAADELGEPASVDVLGTDGSQAYVMTHPASTYACCTCPAGTQRKPCKHHIAWLLAQAPDDRQPEAVRLVVHMLGTRLGFAGGCTMEDTSNLFHALQALHGWACATMVASLDMQDNPPPEQEHPAVCGDKAGPSNVPPPGAVAMQNHVHAILQMVNAQLEQIAQADPGKQRDMMTMQKSVIVQLSENIRVAASKAHELRPSFAMNEDVSFKRHKSFLEKSSTEKTSKQHVPRPGQSNFTSSRKDDSQHVSKALKGGRTAMQAAEHVQACINASQRAAKQPPPQPPQQQRRHLQMPLAVQHQLLQQQQHLHQQHYFFQQQQEHQDNSTQSNCAGALAQQEHLALPAYLQQQDKRRLDVAEARGQPIARSSLAFPPHFYDRQ